MLASECLSLRDLLRARGQRGDGQSRRFRSGV